MSKKCTKCGEIKELSAFSVRNKKTGSRRGDCTPCRSAYNRARNASDPDYREKCLEYYRRNRESICEKSRAFTVENRESVNEAARKRYSDKKDAISAKNKEKRKVNGDEIRAADRKRYSENPTPKILAAVKWASLNKDKRKVHWESRRARKSGAVGSFSKTQWQSRLDYYGGKCVYCGSTEKIEIEHRIPLSRGGTNFPANLVPACKSCNCSKGTKTEKEFKQHLALKGN